MPQGNTKGHLLRETFADRIQRLIDAGIQKIQLSRLFGTSEASVYAWMKGSVPFESTLRQISETSGVSMEWLKYGRGNFEDVLVKIREAIEQNTAKNEAVMYLNESPENEMEMMPMLEILSANLPEASLSQMLNNILLSRSLDPEKRRKIARFLNQKITSRLET